MPTEQIALRNNALCALLLFKEYIPRAEVRKAFSLQQPLHLLRWWHIPSVGNYNTFELKFHTDWNWIISAVLEFRKYRGVDLHGTHLHSLFTKIEKSGILDLNLVDLWIVLTDYAMAVVNVKEKEGGVNA